MSEKIRRISIKEFREKGYLQEVNRRFFHPLGLALEVIIDDKTGEEKLGGVWDYRDDPEGIAFGKDVTSKPDFKVKAENIEKEFTAKKEYREKSLGFFIQPVS